MTPTRWRVGLLAVAVTASAAAIPTLVGAAPAAPAPVALAPTTTAPATTPPATTTTIPTTPTATPTAVSTARPTPKKTTKPSSSPSPITFRPITIDAAAKTNRGSGVAVIECVTCLSGRRVQYLGQGHTLVVPVDHVPVAGRRTLTIAYTCVCSAEPRRLDLRVNDDDAHSLALRGAESWEVPVKTSLRVTLRKGDNQIVFFNANDPAPDLDRIELR